MSQSQHQLLVQRRQCSCWQSKWRQQTLMTPSSEAISLGDQQPGQPASHVVYISHWAGAHGYWRVTFWTEAHRHRHCLLTSVACTRQQKVQQRVREIAQWVRQTLALHTGSPGSILGITYGFQSPISPPTKRSLFSKSVEYSLVRIANNEFQRLSSPRSKKSWLSPPVTFSLKSDLIQFLLAVVFCLLTSPNIAVSDRFLSSVSTQTLNLSVISKWPTFPLFCPFFLSYICIFISCGSAS